MTNDNDDKAGRVMTLAFVMSFVTYVIVMIVYWIMNSGHASVPNVVGSFTCGAVVGTVLGSVALYIPAAVILGIYDKWIKRE
jgi:riboflavin transporter FmnP